jgi:hypothetical protein
MSEKVKKTLKTYFNKKQVLFLTVIVVGVVAFVFLVGNKENTQETSLSNTYNVKACNSLRSVGEKERCWDVLFDSVLEESGLNEGFKLLEAVYEDPAMTSSCHGLAHKLGERAYQVFKDDKAVSISDKVYYCGYGFYHAFMESLLSSGEDISQAKEFCEYVGNKLTNRLSGPACFHGIGHGLLEDVPNPVVSGDDKTVIAKPLLVCNQLSAVEEEVGRCASGVFNVLALYYANQSTGIKINRQDPYAICRTQTRESISLACYDQMNTIVTTVGGNFLNSARYAEAIKEDKFAQAAVHGLAAVYGFSATEDYSRVVSDCRELQQRLFSECIVGFVLGSIEAGKPGQEYVAAQKFCGSEPLTVTEKDLCFEQIIWSITVTYSKEEGKRICSGLVKAYQNKCLERI